MKTRNAAMTGAAALIAGACVFVSSGAHTRDRGPLLRDSAEDVIVPGYRAFTAEATALEVALDGLCEAPDATSLEVSRDAFRSALRAWERTLAWSFGPVSDERLDADIDSWPTSTGTIDAQLASDVAIDLAWVDTLGAGAKGLPALEYLLFASDDVVTNPRRCAYAAALGAQLARDGGELVALWENGYTEELATAGRGSTEWRTQLDAVSAILTQMISAVQRIKSAKLGAPMGKENGGTPQPDAVELPYANASIDAMIATLEGLRALWNVDDGEGLHEAVRDRDTALAARVLDEIDAAIAALRAIPEPLPEYVTSGDLATGETAHAALRTLERTLATDVSGVLAISVMFTDNDGD